MISNVISDGRVPRSCGPCTSAATPRTRPSRAGTSRSALDSSKQQRPVDNGVKVEIRTFCFNWDDNYNLDISYPFYDIATNPIINYVNIFEFVVSKQKIRDR